MQRSRKSNPTRATGEKAHSRRSLIKASVLLTAGGTMAGPLSIARSAHAYGSDLLRIGLVGCGARGTSAAAQALSSPGPVRLVALADVFRDRIVKCLRGLSRHRKKVDVPKDRQFVGFDAYRHLLQSDVDLVVLATPPGFRPPHFETAIRAGKHVFLEKPVAVDAPGVRRVLAANDEACRTGLAVAVGLQRRHEPRYQETVSRLREGIIGDIMLARVYWNGPGARAGPRHKGQKEMEHQLRNWYEFTWLGGDHVVEQHVHNLDVINWVKGAYPVQANGQGGRRTNTRTSHGRNFDYHFVEFTYADGSKMFSQCRQARNCWNCVSEHVRGSRGRANVSGASIYDGQGNSIWRYGSGGGGGHRQELQDLIAALRTGTVPNEGHYGAMSTMTAILGRTAAYSGRSISMDDALRSERAIGPVEQIVSLDDLPPAA